MGRWRIGGGPRKPASTGTSPSRSTSTPWPPCWMACRAGRGESAQDLEKAGEGGREALLPEPGRVDPEAGNDGGGDAAAGDGLGSIALFRSRLHPDRPGERIDQPDLLDPCLAVAGELFAKIEAWIAFGRDLEDPVRGAFEPLWRHAVPVLVADHQQVGLRRPARIQPHRVTRAPHQGTSAFIEEGAEECHQKGKEIFVEE